MANLFEKVLVFFKNNFNFTKQEVLFASLLFVGLLISSFNRLFEFNKKEAETAKYIAHLVDSLAEAERKSFVGTDIYGNPVDTVISNQFSARSRSFKLKETDTLVKININTASRVELMRLPGIGEKTAQSIIDFRKTKKIKRKEDILHIKGIGKKKLQRIEKFITF